MKSPLLPSSFLLSIALLSIFSSCKKDEMEEVVDYREQYIGTYDFTYYYSFTVLGSGTSSYDTIAYIGDVAFAGDSALLVDWPENDLQQELDIELDGSLYKCNTFLGEVNGATFNIEHDDNVCAPGPNGANYTVQIIGTKQ